MSLPGRVTASGSGNKVVISKACSEGVHSTTALPLTDSDNRCYKNNQEGMKKTKCEYEGYIGDNQS